MSDQKFDLILAAILQELKNCDKLNELGKEFSVAEDAETMFRYIFQEPVIANTIAQHTNISPSGKSEKDAENLRVGGNALMAKKSYGQALDVYNMSILTAPHPPGMVGRYTEVIDQGEGTQSYKSLAYGFAERSRLLFELKEFKRCIVDIDRAMKFESVKPLHSELMKMKAKCYILINMYKEAKEVLDTLAICLSPAKEGDSDQIAELEVISKLQQITGESLPEDKTRNNNTLDVPSPNRDEWVLFQYKTSHPPELKSINPSVPSFSDALKVECNPLKGRYVVATRDILPGEVVAMAKGYVCVPNPTWSNLRTHCTLCLLRCHNPIPCPTCARAVFCSEKCREEAMKTFHNIECSFLPTLIDIDIGTEALRSFRLVIGETFSKLKDCVPILRKEAKEKPRHLHGFNEEGIYKENDYRAIYHLEGNIPSRSILDLFHKSSKAFLLTNMLQQTNKFFMNDCGETLVPRDEDLILTGSVLLNHLLNLSQNSFAITEFQINIEDYMNDAKQQNIAGGCYSALSLFNHSCCASTARTNYGDVLVMYAKRFIKAGNEVSTSYGCSYHNDRKEDRQERLLNDYKFECSCEACDQDWPLLEDLPDATLRSADTFIRYPADSNYSKAIDYSNNDFMQEKLQDILERYHEDFEMRSEQEVMGSPVQEAVEFMERFCVIPCKEYVFAQSLMMRFLEYKSTSYRYIKR